MRNKHNQIITDIQERIGLQDCSNIQIRGGNIKSDGVGIFIGRNCKNITIDGVDLSTDGVGIYLESGSHHNVIANCNIHDGGRHITDRASGIRFRRFGMAMREAIAVDDSQDNLIEENRIENYGLAGITLYRNCNEFWGSGSNTDFERGEGANRNVISGNILNDLKVGIWNKAREYRDLTTWKCGRGKSKVWFWNIPKMPYQQFINFYAPIHMVQEKEWMWPITLRHTIVEDAAKDNVFTGNIFNNVRYPEIDGHL